MENRIVTISRQFGSGGREVGVRLAERLGVPCYDRALIELAAEKSGLSVETVKQYDEKAASRLFYADPYQVSRMTPPVSETVFAAQSELIRRLAEEGPCVIIGRCADQVLCGHGKLLRAFLHAPAQARVARIMERSGLPEEEARELVRVMDKKRRSYYNYFTDRHWGGLESCDVAVNSALLGVEGAVELLQAAYGRLPE